MHIKQQVLIDADPEKVWGLVENPENHSLWNPKVKGTNLISHGKRRVGYRYRITFSMRGRDNEMEAEIREYDPPRRLVTDMKNRFYTDANALERRFEEVYQLITEGDKTLLIQTITIDNAGINLFLRLVIALVLKIGKPVGKEYLVTLKEIIEGND